MPLTKSEISDLKSLQDRVVQCVLNNQNAKFALEQAEANLSSLMWKFENEKIGKLPTAEKSL